MGQNKPNVEWAFVLCSFLSYMLNFTYESWNQKMKSDFNNFAMFYLYLPIITLPHFSELKKITILFSYLLSVP